MNNYKSSSVSAITVVAIIFIVLKLVGVIAWPWVIVLIPVWIEIGLFLLAIILAIIAKLL